MQESFPAARIENVQRLMLTAWNLMRRECKAGRHFASLHQARQVVLHRRASAARFCYHDERPRWEDRLQDLCCDNPRMSIYRKVKKVSPDTVHDFSLQRVKRERLATRDEDWSAMRKAQPCEAWLPMTERWYANLPGEVQPQMLRAIFPRIANVLAAGWYDRDRTLRCFDDLLTDRRGGRKGFPADVLDELHRLKNFYEERNPAASDIWRSAK